MSWYIHHIGENANRSYAEIFETERSFLIRDSDKYIGPYETKEEAIEAAERRGLSLTSLKDTNK